MLHRIVGAVSAPALRASIESHAASSHLLRKANISQLNTMAMVLIVRTDANTGRQHHSSYVVHFPTTCTVIRGCLLSSAASNDETDELHRLELYPGITTFRVEVAGVPYQVQTKKILVAMQARGASPSATWCTWRVPPPPSAASSNGNTVLPSNACGVKDLDPHGNDEDDASVILANTAATTAWPTTRDFWLSNADMDIGRFVKAFYAAQTAHTSHVVHYSVDVWPDPHWMAGRMSCGPEHTLFTCFRPSPPG
jgi:hypothetical protein